MSVSNEKGGRLMLTYETASFFCIVTDENLFEQGRAGFRAYELVNFKSKPGTEGMRGYTRSKQLVSFSKIGSINHLNILSRLFVTVR